MGIDATRGLAMLLIMAAHLLAFADADGSPSAFYVIGGYGAATFVLLAGVGVGLSTGGPRRLPRAALAPAAVTLAVRAVLIAMLGLALGYVVDYEEHAVVVLVSYGLMFLLAVPLIRLNATGAALAAIAVAVVVPVLAALLWNDLPTAQSVNPTFGDVLSDPFGWVVETAVKGVYPALPWMAYLCAGLAVGRLRSLTSRKAPLALLIGGLTLAAAAKATSWMLLNPLGGRARIETASQGRLGATELEEALQWGPGFQAPRDTSWWLATDTPYSGTPLELFGTMGISLALLGAVLLVSRVAPSQFGSLAAVGNMTLTLYVLHLLILSLVPLPWGKVWTFVVQMVVVVLVAVVWMARRGRGPLEGLINSAATRVQRMLLPAPAPAAASPTVDSGTAGTGRHRDG
ncbi:MULTISPECIES: acyltransferase family protein [unclassified Modestobacter]